jgi:SAM-dependent methyltransferase
MTQAAKTPHSPIGQPSRLRRTLITALPLLVLGAKAAAQVPEPQLGTPGKDAGWIPTPAGMVEAMLAMARVSGKDYVVDLGSGDGRIPILAAKRFGARALGIELNGDLVAYSVQAAAREGVADRVKFVRGDIFETDFSSATVVTLFMPPVVLQRLRPKLLDMKPGTRIVSYLFGMDDWEPDEWAHNNGMHGMLWVIPAKAGGDWRIQTGAPSPQTYTVRLEQRFQRIKGHLMFGTAALPLFDARLDGDRIRFTALAGQRRFDFTGTVGADAMAGRLHVTGEPLREWRATRA